MLTFPFYFKINIYKASERVKKDPKSVEAACKGGEQYMNKLKESILNDIIQAMKLPALLTSQAMKLPALQTPPPQDQIILMSLALVYLLTLPLVFVYFLHITLFSLKIKNSSMKIRINHQNDVICFRSFTLNE